MNLFAKLLIWILGAAALAGAFALAFLSGYKSPDSRLWASSTGYPALARRFDWPIPVRVITADIREVSPSVAAEGRLTYLTNMPVPLEMPGIVQSVTVEIGQRVRRGETLYVLDKGGARVDLARLDVALKRAVYEAATESLERTQRLRSEGLITYDALYDYESEQRSAARALALAEESLRLSLFTRSELILSGLDPEDPAFTDELIKGRAPIDGVVRGISIAPGQAILGTSASVIMLVDNMRFLTFVDQNHFGDIASGQTGTLYLMARHGGPLAVTVSHVEPFVANVARRFGDQPPRTFPVWFTIDDTGAGIDRLAEGMNGYVILSYPEERLVIPSRSLMRYSGGEGMVMVMEPDNRVALRKVAFSWSDGVNVAISDGIARGEWVVVGGQHALVEGDLIEPVN